jgi:N-acetylglucosaminyldiphosphoundecaprenol N-acetyl-beta-D-mannosaminyltransferase
MERTLDHIAAALEDHRKGYVCLIGVHGIMEAQRHRSIAQVYAQAWLMVPDGAPTVWVGRWQGFSRMQRVAGPDLMLQIFRRKQFSRFTHFLYGGKAGVADELRDRLTERYPWARIVGTHTPPFRDLTSDEEESLAAQIHALKPDIIWVGISTPKQERFMMRYLPRLDTTLMFGVGAAFDYHTGRIKDSPQWVKSAGLQWLHRLIQDPRHLFWRYLRNNSAFLWHMTLQLTGLRAYPPAKAEPRLPALAQSATERARN